MFNKKNTNPDLNVPINNLLPHMVDADPSSEEYAAMVDQLVKLYKLKEIKSSRSVSPDTLALVAANLAGIMLIVGHERANVVTSKAIGFVQRLM